MPDFDAAAHGLKPVKCVTYMGLVFINCDPDAGDLVASLENIREPPAPTTSSTLKSRIARLTG